MVFQLGAQEADKGGVAPGDVAVVAEEEEVFSAGGERRGKAVLDVADEGGLRPGPIRLGVGDVQARAALQTRQAREEQVRPVRGNGGGELKLIRCVHRRAQFLRERVLAIDEAGNVEVVHALFAGSEVQVAVGSGGEGPVDAQVVDHLRQRAGLAPGAGNELGDPDVLLLRSG